jgi:hypothetical protein
VLRPRTTNTRYQCSLRHPFREAETVSLPGLGLKAASDLGFPDLRIGRACGPRGKRPFGGRGTLVGPHAATWTYCGGGVTVNLPMLLTDNKSAKHFDLDSTVDGRISGNMGGYM